MTDTVLAFVKNEISINDKINKKLFIKNTLLSIDLI
jgi:hypothetical protein